ncbi:MAG TPA: 3-dehydroquinate synthase II [Bacillota bacterium]|nr:3-dehydroquinate synthase II [Bacillota bacterium]
MKSEKTLWYEITTDTNVDTIDKVMFGSKGEILPSGEIKSGDKLLGFLDKPGRHVGLKIEETIKEV